MTPEAAANATTRLSIVRLGLSNGLMIGSSSAATGLFDSTGTGGEGGGGGGAGSKGARSGASMTTFGSS